MFHPVAVVFKMVSKFPSKQKMRRIQISLIAFLTLIILGWQPAGFCQEGAKSWGQTMDKNYKKATFAGGCFWCMQSEFDHLKGIISTAVGYTGGNAANPTYEEVSRQDTGHAEAIEIIFDPDKIGYQELLDIFWSNIDPTTLDQQFADMGSQYRTAIFYHDEKQLKLALASKERLEKSGKFNKPALPPFVIQSVSRISQGFGCCFCPAIA